MTKDLHVSDPHRKNGLSLTPGGCTVTIVKHDGGRLHYDKIKNPEAYIKKASLDLDVVEILVDGVSRWTRESKKQL